MQIVAPVDTMGCEQGGREREDVQPTEKVRLTHRFILLLPPPLHMITGDTPVESVRLLVHAGGRLDAVNARRETPVSKAVLAGHASPEAQHG